ncbi:DUF4214 domain-containing protein [Aquamicrobium lusatiense]|uniref:DUF4214 domain-containing protein n=1 Tax=Aquamicrobium lusatiense TaxID=89772 RepID=UPI002454997B|nr:DUF4214 domain-containing protein [Aquamicrobium lusatiense]MDH4989435.1 DUF4214 domain-containing protein [Aquamicrobium lusatiense]
MIARLCMALAGLLGVTAAWSEDLRWGVNGHPFTAYPDISFAQQLDYVRDLGMTSYRVNVSSLDHTAGLPALVKEAKARGIDILPVLTPDLDLDTETAGDLYAKSYAMAMTLVSRFSDDIRVWELGNEMEIHALISACEMRDDGTQYDCSWGTAGGDDPSHYFTPRWKKVSAVLRGLSDGTEAADPTIRKAMGTAGWGHTGAFERMKMDGIDWDISVWHHYGDDLKRPLDYLRTLGKPVWITEFNRSGEKGEQDQADGLLEMMRQFRELGAEYRIEAAHIYELLDEPYWAPSFEATMGLVRLRKTDEGRWTPDGVKLAYSTARGFIAAGGNAEPTATALSPAPTCDRNALDTSVANHANQAAYLYCLALHSLPAPAEQWRVSLALKRGQSAAAALAEILETSEFRRAHPVSRMTNANYIKGIYMLLLGREPDGRGLSDYLARLNRRELTPAQLALEIIRSDEFRSAHAVLFAQENKRP